MVGHGSEWVEPNQPASHGDENRQTERSERRFVTKLAATVIFERQPIVVEIVDLSCAGACVRGAGLPKRGEEIVLRADGLEVVGTIVWSDDRARGINFHKAIAPLAVLDSTVDLPNLNTFTKALAMRG